MSKVFVNKNKIRLKQNFNNISVKKCLTKKYIKLKYTKKTFLVMGHTDV